MKRALSLLVPLALFAAACGGDDDDAGGDEDSGVATTIADDESGDDESGDDESGDDESGEGPSSDWCTLGDEMRESDDALDGVDFMDADSLRTTLEELRSVLDRAQDVAPEEISADVQTSREAFDDFYGILEDADFNFLDVDLEALESFGDEAAAAGDRIDEYNREVCGFLDDEDSGTATTTTSDDDAAGDDESSATLPSGSGDLRSQLIDQMTSEFVAQGFTEDEARCIAESFDLEGMLSGDVDFTDSAVMDSFEECGISLDRLSEMGGG